MSVQTAHNTMTRRTNVARRELEHRIDASCYFYAVFIIALVALIRDLVSLGEASISVNQEKDQECMASSTANNNENCVKQEDKQKKKPAECLYEGKRTSIDGPDSPFDVKPWNNNDGSETSTYRVLVKDKPVLYISNFLNDTMIDELMGFCLSDTNRFKASPHRDPSSGELGQSSSNVENSKKNIRTSESCAMVPAGMYLQNPRFHDMVSQRHDNPQYESIVREVEVTWDISQKAIQFLQENLLQQEDTTTTAYEVEPLQMVRYTHPSAQYTEHHDHGGFYSNEYEHRPYTILVFLSTLQWDEGGMTSFPKLNGLKISPNKGDAILWSNENKRNGQADPDMVHAGEPPSIEGVEKYALNVWIKHSKESDMMNGAWETK